MPIRRRPEQQIQRSVVDHLRCRGARDPVWWHVPNGGARREKEAAILKGLGVRPGVADICVVHDGKFFALELKAPSGRSSAAQIAFRHEINAVGGFDAEAVGLDAAVRCLESWGVLRGRVT
jgi:hypothetical protein